MGKFAIACPKCGNYVTAYNGMRGLIKNKITCSNCGNEIDVRAERMTSTICPSCKNTVIYDQGKTSPICPVCKNYILPTAKTVEFRCPECGVSLMATQGTTEYDCPICDNHIDVQRELAKTRFSKEGLVSLIKYEGDNNTLVWKHPIEDFNTGSQLIVHESQEAVFYRDGQALDLFGAGRYTLETPTLPMMESLYKLPTGDTAATFHSEIYFVNLTTITNIKWGTDTKVRLFDPNSGMHVSIGASGEFNIRVTDSRKILLKLVGTTSGLLMRERPEEIRDQSDEKALESGEVKDKSQFSSHTPNMRNTFRAMIMTRVKSNLARAVKEKNISILEIDEHLDELSAALREAINGDLNEYGLTMPDFFVVRIVTPEDDSTDPAHDDYMRMKQLYAKRYLGTQEQAVQTEIVRAEGGRKVAEHQVQRDVALAARETQMVEAQTAADIELLKAQVEAQKTMLQAGAEAEGYRMQASAEAEEMRMKGYTYQQESSRQIGLQAMQNGITGGGSSVGSAIGDLAGLGVSLGAMGSVIGMTKDAISPLTEASAQMGKSFADSIDGGIPSSTTLRQQETWDCPLCGRTAISSNFCPECGCEKPKPPVPDTWDCPVCGKKSIATRFCPDCGTSRPEPAAQDTWNCPTCGKSDITSNFCPECGTRRPVPNAPVTWTCPSCGEKGITSNFCPQCGFRKP